MCGCIHKAVNVGATGLVARSNKHPLPMDNVSIDNGFFPVCHNDTISSVLTSQFLDLPFSANAHFRKIVPIRKTRVKYFKIHPSERIRINSYSYNYTVSNAKKASAKPIFRVKSTCD